MKQFKVAVGLTQYTVKFRKNVVFKGTECDGLCDPIAKVIWLQRRSEAYRDAMLVAFWHEYAHALFFELGCPDLATNESFIESIGSNLARASLALPKEFLK